MVTVLVAFIVNLVGDTDTDDVATALVEETLMVRVEDVLAEIVNEEVKVSSVKESTHMWSKE